MTEKEKGGGEGGGEGEEGGEGGGEGGGGEEGGGKGGEGGGEGGGKGEGEEEDMICTSVRSLYGLVHPLTGSVFTAGSCKAWSTDSTFRAHSSPTTLTVSEQW